MPFARTSPLAAVTTSPSYCFATGPTLSPATGGEGILMVLESGFLHGTTGRWWRIVLRTARKLSPDSPAYDGGRSRKSGMITGARVPTKILHFAILAWATVTPVN